ncbi:pentatricopeptide repeat-containing protein At4g13650 [Magnolia sinica]|uniref:pentatricopeptide repeat-containing protein At4g13650 n=1 Tax=Magnolia sinica TaxID=86752 RepID=UPI002658B2F2|nr:pentatricopeptide repeat-containing protein At4g13650 [Magnolia sinica]
MPATASCLLGIFSNSLISHFPPKIATAKASKSHRSFLKSFVGSVGKLTSAGFTQSAACHAFDEFYDVETVGNSNKGKPKKDIFYFLHLMEERGLRADCNTYLWLLDGCLNSGCLLDVRRVHARILKLGFGAECVLADRLIGVYSGFGNLDDAVRVLDEMSHRSVASWNVVLSGYLGRKMNRRVLDGFLIMVNEYLEPDPIAFASALRACSGGGDASFHCVKQIHAKIFRLGFACNSIVGNPLIDSYSKHGSIDSARLVFEGLNSRDSITWVAMISGFSQNGRAEEALLLFSRMQRLGITPTPYVFSSVLSACTKIEFFDYGMQLHAQVFKWGFRSETFVGNALVTLYSRCGNMSAAEQIFSEMHRHDGITYNALISGHAQHGNSNSAPHFFRKMQHSGFKPDCVAVASLLSACASAGALHKGRELHSYVIKAGHSSDVIIEGSLLDLYVKCADIETAHEFFDTTYRENVVLWNVMLVAYGQMGNLRESFKLFSEMQVEGMEPNQYTYPSILRTCTALGALHLGEQIHTQIVKTGFELNVYVCSVLIDMYAKCGRLKTAREILDRLMEKDVVSWTALIAGYAQHEYCIEALRLFEEMQTRGIRSDNIGLASALSACAGIQALNQGLQIHAQSFVSGYSMDLSIGNSLVNLYARCGRIKDAYSAFDTIEAKDEISWNGLISGFAQSGHCEEALQVFARMNQSGVGANLFTYGSAISASANIADVKQGKQIHAQLIKTGYDSEIEGGNVLITLYSKCGIIEDAKREFSVMSERNEVSWNAMITGYSQHGFGSEALKLFEQMKQHGLKPNHVTFVGVLSACSHVGLVAEGLLYFKCMSEEHSILPRPEHYACVVDILGRAGLLDQARKFIEEMPIDPDAMVWRTLLSACRVHRKMEIGELAARHLLELEPHDSATYVLLSNIYAVARKWDRRDHMRQMMKDRGVKKEPGRSWIEVKNSFHAFFVGDRLHPLSDKIYESFEDLNKKVAEIGYVQDRYSLLHDIEQEQKDPTVYIHSEKLAVAFGLISLAPEIPIRVIKNLRVCNDCHNWMKLVSTTASRTIIVRDAYRFHHFEGGVCSCRDYW